MTVGSIIPNAVGTSEQQTGDFGPGYAFFTVLSVVVCGLLFFMQRC